MSSSISEKILVGLIYKWAVRGESERVKRGVEMKLWRESELTSAAVFCNFVGCIHWWERGGLLTLPVLFVCTILVENELL